MSFRQSRGAWTVQAHTRQNPGRGGTPGTGTAGGTPGTPSNVTSVTADAAATVSFTSPVEGSSAITSYTVTPYISGVAQAPQTVSASSAVTLTGSSGTFLQVPVTGLTNSTAYTFSVHASNSSGAGPESAQSGANTPLSGLVFGDDFNGPANGPIDPEWWVYTRCGYLAQSEIEYYLPSQVTLDGNSNLLLTATMTSYTGPSYPSAGGGNVTQPWRSGACQSNVRTYAPSSGNTMTFEANQQVCPDAGGGGMWPGLFWLEGQHFLNLWKTDPDQPGWNTTDEAEIDVAEWDPSTVNTPDDYANNVFTGSGGGNTYFNNVNTATDFSASQHVFSVQWKPGVSCTFFRDGSQTGSTTSVVPASGAQFFLLLYLQILSGSATATQSCKIDYVRVFDQNLG